MRIPRIYCAIALDTHQSIILPTTTSHYLGHVLRLKKNAPLILFNGQGGEYHGTIEDIQRHQITVQLAEYIAIERESSLEIHLAQSISRSEHMDYAIQKAVELGTQQITPIISERSPKLVSKILQKRCLHWQKIIQSASEQCGRNYLCRLNAPLDFAEWFSQSTPSDATKLAFIAGASTRLVDIKTPLSLTLLIGAEGGFSADEKQRLKSNYTQVSLGKRILRTETASTAVLAGCQLLWGDMC